MLIDAFPLVRVTTLAKSLEVTYPTAKADVERLESLGILEELPNKTLYAPEIIRVGILSEPCPRPHITGQPGRVGREATRESNPRRNRCSSNKHATWSQHCDYGDTNVIFNSCSTLSCDFRHRHG